MVDKYDKYLSDIYYEASSPASYSGVEKLWSHVREDPDRPQGIDRRAVSAWLDGQHTHRIFSAPRKPHPYESLIVEHPFQIWDTDIVFVDFPKENRGYRYVICFLDLFSRYLWVRPLKKKTGEASTAALKSVLKEAGDVCRQLRSDSGTEYMNRQFQEALREYGIKHLIARGRHKANYVERVQRTIQDRLYRFFYQNQTHNFVDNIQAIVKSYNNTVHSTTKVKPVDVDENNFYEIYQRVYLPILNKRAGEKKVYSFEVGDLVQLLLTRGKFTRSYDVVYTEELFRVTGVIKSSPPRYKLQDLLGTEIKGSFYEYQLLKFRTNDIGRINFKIEKVLWTRVKGGRKVSLVKWLGYDERHNSILPTAQIKSYMPNNPAFKRRKRKSRRT